MNKVKIKELVKDINSIQGRKKAECEKVRLLYNAAIRKVILEFISQNVVAGDSFYGHFSEYEFICITPSNEINIICYNGVGQGEAKIISPEDFYTLMRGGVT